MPLSGAERSRRYIARLKAEAGASKPEHARTRRTEALLNRIERLESQVDGLKAQLKGSSDRRDHWYRETKARERRIAELLRERDPEWDAMVFAALRSMGGRFNRPPDGEHWRKVKKLVSLLGSDQEGERQNALDALRRMLANNGLSFSDLANRLR